MTPSLVGRAEWMGVRLARRVPHVLTLGVDVLDEVVHRRRRHEDVVPAHAFTRFAMILESDVA